MIRRLFRVICQRLHYLTGEPRAKVLAMCPSVGAVIYDLTRAMD